MSVWRERVSGQSAGVAWRKNAETTHFSAAQGTTLPLGSEQSCPLSLHAVPGRGHPRALWFLAATAAGSAEHTACTPRIFAASFTSSLSLLLPSIHSCFGLYQDASRMMREVRAGCLCLPVSCPGGTAAGLGLLQVNPAKPGATRTTSVLPAGDLAVFLTMPTRELRNPDLGEDWG